MKLFGKVTEEIVIQRCGNTLKQGNVNVVLTENPMDMRSGTTNVFGQLRGRNTLLPHYLFYMLPDVHKKSVEFITCWSLGFHAHLINKLFHANAFGVSERLLDEVPPYEALWKFRTKNSF